MTEINVPNSNLKWDTVIGLLIFSCFSSPPFPRDISGNACKSFWSVASQHINIFFLIVSNLNLLSLRSDWSVIGKLRKQILGVQFPLQTRVEVRSGEVACTSELFLLCLWMYMLYRLLRSDPKTHSGNCYLHWTRASSKQNGATADELPPSYSAFSEPCSIEPVCFTTREKWFVFTISFLQEIFVPIMISISCL